MKSNVQKFGHESLCNIQSKAKYVFDHITRIFVLNLIIIYQTQSSELQTSDRIEQLLISRNFVQLTQYLDSLQTQKKITGFQRMYSREIVPRFYETVVLYNKKEFIDTVQYYKKVKLDILSYDNTIVKHILSEQKILNVDSIKLLQSIPIYSNRNDSLFHKLETGFLSLYKQPLDEDELFVINNRYATGCGYDGDKPRKRIALEFLVRNKDTIQLYKWLTSTNTETQLYAVEGIYRLSKSGYFFSKDITIMIEYVKAKKGTALTCNGCMTYYEKVSNLTKDYSFE